jgi:zinc transport system substrate-binding protein
VNLGHRQAALLPGERLDDSCSRPAGLEAGLAKRSIGVVNPAHRPQMIAILIPGSVPAVSRIVLVLILILGLTGCGGDDSAANSEQTEVVASFYPLAWAAEQVGGNGVHVRNLTPPGTEPHDAELTARDVERIRSADVVLYLGGGFQPAVEAAVNGATGKTVDLLVDTVGGDPHVWLDPRRFERIAVRVAQTLGDSADATALGDKLRKLDRDFASGLARCRTREIVTSHDAFGYLARRYRLEEVAITGISPEVEPTPQQLERVIDEVKRTKAKTVFFERLVSPRLAETVARETGASTDVLNPIEGLTEDELDAGETYLSAMRENLATLRKALECR